MQCYCESCGFKNVYAALKPKACSSCSASLEPKPAPPRRPARTPRYEEAEVEEFDDIPVEEQFHLDPKSFRFEKYEGGLLTIEQLRKGGGEALASRGEISREFQKTKDEVMGAMLGGKPSIPDIPPPPETKPRSTARRRPSKFAPPAE